jgi:hypothetical protein
MEISDYKYEYYSLKREDAGPIHIVDVNYMPCLLGSRAKTLSRERCRVEPTGIHQFKKTNKI